MNKMFNQMAINLCKAWVITVPSSLGYNYYSTVLAEANFDEKYGNEYVMNKSLVYTPTLVEWLFNIETEPTIDQDIKAEAESLIGKYKFDNRPDWFSIGITQGFIAPLFVHALLNKNPCKEPHLDFARWKRGEQQCASTDLHVRLPSSVQRLTNVHRPTRPERKYETFK